MSFVKKRGILYPTSRKKEVPHMLYAAISIIVLGGAMYLTR